MAGTRFVAENPIGQGAAESKAYSITTTPWASTPSSLSMTVWDVTDADNPSDVSSTVTTGSITALGDVITTKRIRVLTILHNYLVRILFTDANSNIWEILFTINCSDR